MKIVEHLANSDETIISFEIIPPRRGSDITGVRNTVSRLANYKPPFIDVTSHAAEAVYEETKNGIERKVRRKRPGTLGICSMIKERFNIEPVPHVLCKGFSKEETENFLIDLNYSEIDNILALRGDDPGFIRPIENGKTVNEYAINLVEQIKSLNKGLYLDSSLLNAEGTDFCIGVAGYPEKHFQAPNLMTDIRRTKEKVDAGADYIVTQMFFDNRHYFKYVDTCRQAGINVPIIPGIKVLTSKEQLKSLPSMFHIDIPLELTELVMDSKEEKLIEAGVKWTYAQVEELLKRDVPCVHFYVMLDSSPVEEVLGMLGF